MLDINFAGRLVTAIAPTDMMWNAAMPGHYFGVGLSNLHAIRQAVAARASFFGHEPLRDILDFGCGCGRVTRFMRAAWPDSRTWVTDLRKQDEAWVAKELGCEILPAPLPAKNSFDLIFLGSVFTHLPQQPARDLLVPLLAALRPGGLLVFTTQGRSSYERLVHLDWEQARQHPWMSYRLPPADVAKLVASYRDEGYGFVNYQGQTAYGVTVAPAQWYCDTVLGLDDVTQVMHWERGCDDHQDVLGFIKRPIRAGKSSTFLRESEKMFADLSRK